MLAVVEHRLEWLVLLGLRATAPDPELGWIEPGHAIGSTTAGPIARVERFREKPEPPVAAACLARGQL